MKTRYEEMLAQQLQELRNELETRFNSKVEIFTQLLYNPQHKCKTVKYSANSFYGHLSFMDKNSLCTLFLKDEGTVFHGSSKHREIKRGLVIVIGPSGVQIRE